MSIKLLPASVNPVDPSAAFDVSTSLVPLSQRAIATRAGQSSLAPSADKLTWSSAVRPPASILISGTVVEDSQRDESGTSLGEYLSGWTVSRPIESTAA